MAEDLLTSFGTVYMPRILGPWQLLYGRSSLQTSMELRGLVGATMYAQVELRTATVDTNDPDPWDTVVGPGTGRNSNGIFPEAFDLSGSGYNGKMWVQTAISAKYTSSPTMNCRARLWSSVIGNGWIAARHRLNIEAGVTNQTVQIGSPFGAAGVNGMLFGVIYSGFNGDDGVTPTFTYRTFQGGDVTRPDNWASKSAETEVAVDSRAAYPVSVTSTNKMLVQAGLSYTSDADATGTMDIIVAAKT